MMICKYIHVKLSCVVRKPAFCICENKDADQLRGYREADQRLVFTIVQYLFYQIRNFKPLAIFSDCAAGFVSDLVGNPEDQFSHNEAKLVRFATDVQMSARNGRSLLRVGLDSKKRIFSEKMRKDAKRGEKR